MLERFIPTKNDITVWGTVGGDTSDVRRLAAFAAREHLPYQLDWRLDAALDPHGQHVVGVKAGPKEEVFSQHRVGPLLVCLCYLKMLGADDPFFSLLSVRMSDLAKMEPLGKDKASPRMGMQIGVSNAELQKASNSPRTPGASFNIEGALR